MQRLANDVGDIDILINNAGISVFAPTAEFDIAAFDKMFASNVRAPFFLVAALAPGMAARGRGSIVSLSSMAGGVGLVGGAAYGATKASLEAMTRAWAAEYSASGVRVNAIAPGPVYSHRSTWAVRHVAHRWRHRGRQRAQVPGGAVMAGVVRAVTSFVTTVKGEEHVVHAGDVLRADHPVVKEHPGAVRGAGHRGPR